MSDQFIEYVRTRRSAYAIQKSSPIPDDKIIEIVTESTKHCPSSLNLMPGRTVLLLGAEHQKFWGIADQVQKVKLSPEDYAASSARIQGFAAGYGTVLFFIEQEAVAELAIKHPKIALKAQQFAEHTTAMNQYIVWTALTLEGFGCSLQHQNPTVNAKTREAWDLPETWILTAQLVFGEKVSPPKEKTFTTLGDKVKVFK
ncbi:putative nitroreductase family protein [Ilyonectria destructans]|nr:putative nitroreductase family protein [Ilyonectria destructans]